MDQSESDIMILFTIMIELSLKSINKINSLSRDKYDFIFEYLTLTTLISHYRFRHNRVYSANNLILFKEIPRHIELTK